LQIVIHLMTGPKSRADLPLVVVLQALWSMPTGQWVTEDEPHPAIELEPWRPAASAVVLTGPCHPRAISSGHERYPADTHGHSTRPLDWAPVPDLRWGRSPKLHGMQGVSCVGPAQLRVIDHVDGQVPRVEATGPPWLAALSGGPPPAARPTACPGQPHRAGER
jgi:hypothetical protein